MEKWELIEGSRGYYISDQGRVKHIYKNGKEKIMSLYSQKYKVYGLVVKISYSKGEYTPEYVSELVYRAFNSGEIKENQYVGHKNGDINDNSIGNLVVKEKKMQRKLSGVYKIHPHKNVIIKRYRDTKEAGNMEYLNPNTIYAYCVGTINSLSINGYRWSFGYDMNMKDYTWEKEK